MARTLDPEAHAVRRDVFIDAAQRLIQAKGFDQMSIQDVLGEVGTSKGAFYHYFDSKGALLDGVVERMVEAAWATVDPIIADPDRSAIDKLRGVFSGISSWKTARKELLLAILDVWMADENALVREKFRRAVDSRLTPSLAAIIRQGCSEGAFTASSPDDAARVLVALIASLNVAATDLFRARQANEITTDDVRRSIRAYGEAFERILGAPPGSLPLVEESVIREWFD